MCYAFCSGYRPRWFVKLFDKYQFYCPKATQFWSAFYLQSVPDWKPGNDFWYLHFPVGKGTLAAYTAELMEAASIPGDYSNHFLRHMTVTTLHHKNVGKQLIKEQTRHHSNAVERYAKTNMKQKEKVK